MGWLRNLKESSSDLNFSLLSIDECYVKFESTIKESIWLYSVFEDCYRCPYTKYQQILTGSYGRKSSSPKSKWRFLNKDDAEFSYPADPSICDIEPSLGEFGEYVVNIENTGCSVTTITEPANIYLPLIVPVLIFFFAITFYLFYKKAHKKSATVQACSDTAAVVVPRKRFAAIDTVRGISIVIMIFVNEGAGQYQFMDHAVWNGLRIADLVFPWFMWIMGTCIPISNRSQLRRNVPKLRITGSILKRSVILFLLGLMVNTAGTGPELKMLRIFGVLQRFAVCYCVVALIALFCTRMSNSSPPQTVFAKFIEDITVLLPQWGVVFAILILHFVLTFALHVPDCPSGYLGPGGLHENGLYVNCTGGAAGYIDRLILGENHMLLWSTSALIYQSITFDPEGILGCLTSIVQVMLGVQAGSILLVHKTVWTRVFRWLAWAGLTGLIGALLCGFSKEGGWIPVNKNLWSISFVLVTSSLAFMLLTACYLLIDVYDYWTGKPFLFAGMNSTIMYVGHSVCYKLFPFHWIIGSMNSHYMMLMEAVWTTFTWVLVAYWLWRVKFFLSV